MASSTTYYISCRYFKLLISSIKRPKSPRPLSLCVMFTTIFRLCVMFTTIFSLCVMFTTIFSLCVMFTTIFSLCVMLTTIFSWCVMFTAICSGGCYTNAFCLKPELCRCKPGYHGDKCEHKSRRHPWKRCKRPCRHGGRCRHGNCKCRHMYYGATCQYSK